MEAIEVSQTRIFSGLCELLRNRCNSAIAYNFRVRHPVTELSYRSCRMCLRSTISLPW